MDKTPPSQGHVYDGLLDDAGDGAMDKDFVTSPESMGAHWGAFADPQSSMKHFSVKVGTCANCEDTILEYEASSRTGK